MKPFNTLKEFAIITLGTVIVAAAVFFLCCRAMYR